MLSLIKILVNLYFFILKKLYICNENDKFDIK